MFTFNYYKMYNTMYKKVNTGGLFVYKNCGSVTNWIAGALE